MLTSKETSIFRSKQYIGPGVLPSVVGYARMRQFSAPRFSLVGLMSRTTAMDYANPPHPPPPGRAFVVTRYRSGVAVTFPGKIDNSDETRKPRDDVGKVRRSMGLLGFVRFTQHDFVGFVSMRSRQRRLFNVYVGRCRLSVPRFLAPHDSGSQAIADIDEHSNLTPPNPLPLCRPARPDRPPAGLQRTGPIPKAEKNTWKQKTKYRWSMDDGLLAKRTRRAANAKSFEKKRRSGGGYDDW